MKFSFVVSLVLLAFVIQQVQGRKKQRRLEDGAGINFPRRPLSKQEASRYVFNRRLFSGYRISNPLFGDDIARDLELFYEERADGDLDEEWDARFEGTCLNGTWLYRQIPGEYNRAVYTFDGPFPTTGEGITVSFFTCEPDNYVFIFFCLDRTKEVVRNGKRVFCDAPWRLSFMTYENPADRVMWCAAESDLRRSFGITFDNEYTKYVPTGTRCHLE